MDPVAEASASSPPAPEYSRYLESKLSVGDSIQGAMNGVIKKKLKIIPKDVE